MGRSKTARWRRWAANSSIANLLIRVSLNWISFRYGNSKSKCFANSVTLLLRADDSSNELFENSLLTQSKLSFDFNALPDFFFGAGEGARTLDLKLGKLAL